MHVALKHGPCLQSVLKEDWPPRPQATAKVELTHPLAAWKHDPQHKYEANIIEVLKPLS